MSDLFIAFAFIAMVLSPCVVGYMTRSHGERRELGLAALRR